MDQARHRPDAEFELVDLVDHPLPHLDEPLPPNMGAYQNTHTQEWAAVIARFDGFVFITPEYNHSTSGVLKNAIDYLYLEWKGKPVACVGYGWSGAQYARSALRQTLDRVGMVVVEGSALFFDKTLDTDGTVRADASCEAEVATMYAGLTDAVLAGRTSPDPR